MQAIHQFTMDKYMSHVLTHGELVNTYFSSGLPQDNF